MKKSNIVTSAITLGAVVSLFVGAFPVAAQSVDTPLVVTANGALATLASTITAGDQAIADRIARLMAFNLRIQGMGPVTDAKKASVGVIVQTNIAGLTTLKTKLDGDTDLATARADYKTIFTNFRIYALVVPQQDVLSRADRITSIVADVTATSTLLSARILSAQSAGHDVSTLTTTLTDLQSRLASATTHALDATLGVAGLVPDEGDVDVATANALAIDSAQAHIALGNADLVAIALDRQAIRIGLQMMTLAAPVAVSPVDGAVIASADLTSLTWSVVTDDFGTTSYIYEASKANGKNADGSFVSPIYTSGHLPTPSIATGGNSAGVYYWHVKAVDTVTGAYSKWSATSRVRVTQ
jgi:hypothetical protein